MGKLDGKVAFITGAARGQGRAHAVRLAEEGADIAAIDICGPIDSISYQMGTEEDLQITVKEVENLGRRIIARKVDVRDAAGMRAVVGEVIDKMGHIDIAIANAGIAPQGGPIDDPDVTFRDVVETNLFGVWNTVSAIAPTMVDYGRGGSIIIISSTQGLSGRGGNGSAANTGYAASKHAVVGVMRSFSAWLAPLSIRVNTVHPTGVATPMVQNEVVGKWIRENPDAAMMSSNAMPVALLEPNDISSAVLFLASDESRYITGTTLPVDAGCLSR